MRGIRQSYFIDTKLAFWLRDHLKVISWYNHIYCLKSLKGKNGRTTSQCILWNKRYMEHERQTGIKNKNDFFLRIFFSLFFRRIKAFRMNNILLSYAYPISTRVEITIFFISFAIWDIQVSSWANVIRYNIRIRIISKHLSEHLL